MTPRSSRRTRLFRLARPASSATLLLKTLGQIAVVWSFALVFLPAIVVTVEDWVGVPRWRGPVASALGVGVFAAGSATGLWSAWLMAVHGRGTPVPFDAARVLVVRGPYRVVRNPMAVSAIGQTLGIACSLGSTGVIALAVGGGLVWHWFIRPPEERFLLAQFGADYLTYRTQVRCWVPRWPPYTALGGSSGA